MQLSEKARLIREEIHQIAMANEEFMARAREAQKAAREDKEVHNDR